jgi:ribosomal protein L17
MAEKARRHCTIAPLNVELLSKERKINCHFSARFSYKRQGDQLITLTKDKKQRRNNTHFTQAKKQQRMEFCFVALDKHLLSPSFAIEPSSTTTTEPLSTTTEKKGHE